MADDRGRAFAADDIHPTAGADRRCEDVVKAVDAQRTVALLTGLDVEGHQESLTVLEEIQLAVIEQR